MAEFIKFIEILKWPVVILVALWIFRKSIKELILNIADFSITKDGLSARIARPSVKISSNKTTETVKSDNPNTDYISENKEGEVFFNYSNNNGIYTIGKDDYRFDTQWSKASKEYIHFYNDQSTIKSIRLVKDISDLDKVQPEKYDSSSRARTAGINQVAVFENNNGKLLAIKILGIKDDSRGDNSDELYFKYKILAKNLQK
ncbi:hypothetical protein KJ840_01795 [Patescibacteria group bacterium]|nr:hypothetical protein [Patescibacteria group bacterium]